MPEPQGEQNGGQQGGTTPPEPKPFTPITTQDDLNRIITERVQRERGKYADYSDLKAKAARLDEIEQANKSEAQKLADRAAAAEQKAAKAEAAALRLQVAAAHGVSTKPGPNGEPSDADLFLTGSDVATLTKQAERLAERQAERAADRKRSGNRDPFAGRTTNTDAGNSTMREFTRGLFNRD